LSPTVDNLFADIPEKLPEELEQLLASGGKFELRRIVSRGHSSPADFWYDQAEAEWVIVIKGDAVIEFDDGNVPAILTPGDHLYIPPHCRHRVSQTSSESDTIWLALYFDEINQDHRLATT